MKKRVRSVDLSLFSDDLLLVVMSYLGSNDLHRVSRCAQRMVDLCGPQFKTLVLQSHERSRRSQDKPMFAIQTDMAVFSIMQKRWNVNKLVVRDERVVPGLVHALITGCCSDIVDLDVDMITDKMDERFTSLSAALSRRSFEFTTCRPLTHLTLRRVSSGRGLRQLLRSSFAGRHLQEIHIVSSLDTSQASDLGSFLKCNCPPNLRVLEVTGDMSYVFWGSHPIQALIHASRSNRCIHIERISMPKLRVRHWMLEDLASAIETKTAFPRLKSLSLCHYDFDGSVKARLQEMGVDAVLTI